MITIRHDRESGTLVHGTARRDGAGEPLKSVGFRPSRNLPDHDELGSAYWYLPHSRDRRADTWTIERAARLLREAGFDVRVDLDDVTPASTAFAEREEQRRQHAEDRAERYAERAGRAIAKGEEMLDEVRQARSRIPLGQPLMPDHHSYAADRNRRERWHRKEGRAIEEVDRGRYWARRAEAAARSQQHRGDIPTTLRRIDKLEADKRRIERALARPGGDADALRADLDRIDEELAYWRGRVAAAEAARVKVWSKADFVKGDFIRLRRDGVWLEVVRVSAKSVTVPWVIQAIGLPVYTWAHEQARCAGKESIYGPFEPATDRVPYDKIVERATGRQIREMFPQAFSTEAEGS